MNDANDDTIDNVDNAVNVNNIDNADNVDNVYTVDSVYWNNGGNLKQYQAQIQAISKTLMKDPLI